MKIRNGFVSNSSSSSFVISTKKGVTPKIKVEIDLSEYFTKTISTIKECREYIKEYEYVDTDEEIDAEIESDDRYKEMLELIEAGNVIHIGSVSDEMDDPIEAMLCNGGLGNIKTKDIKIIQDCDGY